MCLDLEIRRLSQGNRSLDDVMRHLWRETYERGRGFTHNDVVAAVNAAAGSDLQRLVHELVARPFNPDFESLLASFGLSLQVVAPAAEAAPVLGLQLQPGTTVVATVHRGAAASIGGIAAGDEILALGGLRVTSSSFDEILRAVASPVQDLDVLAARRGRIIERRIQAEPAGERPNYRLEVLPSATTQQVQLRRGWLRDT